MSKTEVKANIGLLMTAAIWGFAFVAQRVGAQYIGAFTFNGIRFLLGAISLLPFLYFLKKSGMQIKGKEVLKSGVIAGILLFAASSLQQIGMSTTTAGKGGFITGLYIVLVPIFGLFLKQKTGKNTWIGIVLSVIGLYLLSVKEGFTMEQGDLFVLSSSFLWAIHILWIDTAAKKSDPVCLSCVQFFVCGLLSLGIAVVAEEIQVSAIESARIPILYGGLLSVGVAYTLQAVSQKHAKPSHAAILLSMESVFGCIGGMLLLGERLDLRGIAGCVLIFMGIIISQIEIKKEK